MSSPKTLTPATLAEPATAPSARPTARKPKQQYQFLRPMVRTEHQKSKPLPGTKRKAEDATPPDGDTSPSPSKVPRHALDTQASGQPPKPTPREGGRASFEQWDSRYKPSAILPEPPKLHAVYKPAPPKEEGMKFLTEEEGAYLMSNHGVKVSQKGGFGRGKVVVEDVVYSRRKRFQPESYVKNGVRVYQLKKPGKKAVGGEQSGKGQDLSEKKAKSPEAGVEPEKEGPLTKEQKKLRGLKGESWSWSTRK